MAELTDDQKLEMVEMLACFRDVTTIINHFGETYGLVINHRQVGGYDPMRPYYEAGDKWRAIFEARRKAYLEAVSAVPIANQGYRINILQEQLNAALKANKTPEVLSILEQAAKEVGGILTNQRELRVDDNRRPKAIDLTPEERRSAMAEIIRVAMEQRALTLPKPEE